MRFDAQLKPPWLAVLLVGAAAFAFGLGAWTMALGPGVSPDSTCFLDAARSLSAGDGLRWRGAPLTRWPPAYPTLLALAGLPGGGPLPAARWLHACFYAVNVALLGLCAWFATKRAFLPTLCAVVLYLACPSVLRVHTMAWSEPPFLAFSLAAFLLLALHVCAPSLWRLAGASAFLALAMLTRYAGPALVPPMLLLLLAAGGRPTRTRVRDSLVLLVVGCGPLALWLVRNALVSGATTGRGLAFHPVDLARLRQAARAAFDYILPVRMHGAFRLPPLLLLLGLTLAGLKQTAGVVWRTRREPTPATALPALLLLAAVVYPLFLLISISFADAHVPLDARILLPAYIWALLFLLALCWLVARVRERPSVAWSAVVFVLLTASVGADRTTLLARALHTEGADFTRRAWARSETVAYVRSLPEGMVVYSNGDDALRFLTGRPVEPLPYKVHPCDHKPNPRFKQQMDAMLVKVAKARAVVVYFADITWRGYLPTQAELAASAGVQRLRTFDDAVVLGGRGVSPRSSPPSPFPVR